MAYSVRSPVPENRLDLKNGAIVECHKNNVFRIYADILVVSRNGSVESGAREKVGAREWNRKKEKASPIILRDWKFVKISTSECQSNFHFSKVYVVQVPVFPLKLSGKKWLEEYANMITKLLTHAEGDGKTSITIPLLGTNAGGAPKDGCVLQVMDAVFKFPKFLCVRKINLVVQGWQEVTLVQELMAEKLGQTSDGDKYKNITQNKRKTHLLPSSKSHDTANGSSRSQDNQKTANGNRYNSLSDQNSHSDENKARGDNQDVRQRSNSRTRTSGASSSNSRPEPTSDSLTSQKSGLTCARDGGEIQNNEGFGINGSLAPRDGDVAGAEGSSVDPAPKTLSAQHGNNSEHQRKGERREDGAKFQKVRGQEDTLIRKGESKHPNNNSYYSDKDSYAKVTMKNLKMESDHKHISYRNSTRSNNKDEDEEFSPGYAASHRKNNVNSDNKNYSKESSPTNYHHEEELSKFNAELDKARLQELKEIEDQDNRSNEMVVTRRQNGNFDSKKSSSNHVIEYKIISHNCSYCKHDATRKFRLPCHHVYCDGCVPGDKGCPQCEVEKLNKEDGNISSNKCQSSNQQTQREDPESRNIEHDKIVYSSDKKEDQESRHQHGNFDSKKSIGYHHLRDIESEKMGVSKRSALIDVSSYNCSYCGHYTTSRFELSCSHMFCIFCEPGDKGCPLCKVENKKSNKEKEKSTHGEDGAYTFENYYCKSCLGNVTIKLSELPCHHFCCFRCFYKHRRYNNPQNCQQCKDERSNKEDMAEHGNEDQKSREGTHVEDRAHISVKYCCKSCSGYTSSKLSELPCQHFCCFLCDNQKCQQCETELLNKEMENKAEPDNRIPSARERTNGEGEDTTLEETCQRCDLSLENNSPVQLASDCSKCAEKGCKDLSCIKDLKGNRDQRPNNDPSKVTHGDDPSNRGQSSSQRTNGEGQDNTMKVKCQRCDSSLENNSPVQLGCGCASPDQSCNKEHKGNRDERSSKETLGDDPSNRDQSSSQRTNEQGQDNPIEEKCQRCDSSLENNSPVQQACGHTFCARCSAKDCKDPSCNEGFKGDTNQTPDNDSSCNKEEVQSSSEINPQDVRAKTAWLTCYRCSVNLENNSPVQLGCGHTFCARCASNGCIDPSCEEEPDYDCDDKNLNKSRPNKDLSDNHSNRSSDTNEPNDKDTRMDNHSWNGSDGNNRDKHSSRGRAGSVHKNTSRGRNGSDGNHRDRNRSRGRDGSVHKHKSSDRNVSDSNHSKRDWHEGEGHDYKEGRSKHGEDDLPPKDVEKTEMCAICMDHITDPKKLDKCGHVFCRECIDNCFKLHKPVCPSCGTMYGVTIGNMPPGTMDVYKTPATIEGFRRYSSYCINYHFNNGMQGSEHPNPGVRFNGTSRTAYLPASPKGVEVCKMLKLAFKRRLTFTIGRSTTTGRENVVTWNDIHHKTSMVGGPTQFGYPDPTYLNRVKEELASKGVTLADIDGVNDRTEFITVP